MDYNYWRGKSRSRLHVDDVVVTGAAGAVDSRGIHFIFMRETSSGSAAEKIQSKDHHACKQGDDEQAEGEKRQQGQARDDPQTERYFVPDREPLRLSCKLMKNHIRYRGWKFSIPPVRFVLRAPILIE